MSAGGTPAAIVVDWQEVNEERLEKLLSVLRMVGFRELSLREATSLVRTDQSCPALLVLAHAQDVKPGSEAVEFISFVKGRVPIVYFTGGNTWLKHETPGVLAWWVQRPVSVDDTFSEHEARQLFEWARGGFSDERLPSLLSQRQDDGWVTLAFLCYGYLALDALSGGRSDEAEVARARMRMGWDDTVAASLREAGLTDKRVDRDLGTWRSALFWRQVLESDQLEKQAPDGALRTLLAEIGKGTALEPFVVARAYLALSECGLSSGVPTEVSSWLLRKASWNHGSLPPLTLALDRLVSIADGAVDAADGLRAEMGTFLVMARALSADGRALLDSFDALANFDWRLADARSAALDVATRAWLSKLARELWLRRMGNPEGGPAAREALDSADVTLDAIGALLGDDRLPDHGGRSESALEILAAYSVALSRFATALNDLRRAVVSL